MEDQGNMVALFKESYFYDDRCGLNVHVVYGGSVTVKIVGPCPPTLCDENTFLALSKEAFSQIADPAAGKIFVDYGTSTSLYEYKELKVVHLTVAKPRTFEDICG
ncbi:hypothetical protein RJ640_017681 [Escallonia rubra]|uniref:RlpA-like protein double-psi beta-barrel domain-containing protein n=1 Tax=Escallonia rubra TaxID=112253 RepID=A0AA88S015_9ASTE|nr:hypothetical protein RJ640_017681 [Escallonia rubra]